MPIKPPSIKTNFIYKSLLTVSNYLMAFITFPYISRVLGVENIGLVNFVDNTINYFLLFATMGVNVLGVREIAKVGNDLEARNKVFSNILGVNTLFTITTLILYFIIVKSIPKLSGYSELLYIGGAKILFTNFLVEWLYTGIEKFRYITIRSILVRIIYIISIFILIKEPGDYKLYFYLTIAVTVVNAIINFIYSRKYTVIIFRELFNLRFLKDNITLGIYSIMTSMYLTFNVMYLGIVSDNIQVGYYTTAFKLYSVVLGFFTAFTNVMLPRMSALVVLNDRERIQQLISKSFSAMSMVSIPLIICTLILAPDIIYVIAGKGYEGAIVPMMIIMPAILLVGIAQVIAIQILMPLNKDKVLLYTSIGGAVFSMILNIVLVNTLMSIGSAIVLLGCESIVTLSYIIYIVRHSDLKIPWHSIIDSLKLSVPCLIICFLCKFYVSNPFITIGVSVPLSVIVWILLLRIKRPGFKNL